DSDQPPTEKPASMLRAAADDTVGTDADGSGSPDNNHVRDDSQERGGSAESDSDRREPVATSGGASGGGDGGPPDGGPPGGPPAMPDRERLKWEDVKHQMPVDKSGRPLRVEEAQHCGWTPEGVRQLHDRTAPLGMTPEQFNEFKSSLHDALRADNIDPSDVDI